MGQEYGFVYAVITAFCMIYAIIVLAKLSGDIGSEREIKYFKRMVFGYIAFTSTEVVWALGNFGVVHMPVAILSLMSSISLIAIGFISFYWFAYGETKMGYHVVGRPVLRAIVYLPLVIVTALYVMSMWNGVMFYYDQNGSFVQGPLYESAVFFDDIYLIVVSAHALIKAVRETSPSRRRDYITLFAFIILPTTAGLIDMFVPTLPLMTPAIFSSILLVFTNVQESQIFNDALTGLNNRRRADAYVEDLLSATSPEHPFYLFMLDVDLFKQINDTYGHIEGDRALTVLADAIRKTCQHYRSFVARWGGDEFMIVAEERNIASPEALAQALEKQLAAEREANGITYPLQASIGWTRCTSPDARISTLVKQADEMLYQNKKIAHAAAQTAA